MNLCQCKWGLFQLIVCYALGTKGSIKTAITVGLFANNSFKMYETICAITSFSSSKNAGNRGIHCPWFHFESWTGHTQPRNQGKQSDEWSTRIFVNEPSPMQMSLIRLVCLLVWPQFYDLNKIKMSFNAPTCRCWGLTLTNQNIKTVFERHHHKRRGAEAFGRMTPSRMIFSRKRIA